MGFVSLMSIDISRRVSRALRASVGRLATYRVRTVGMSPPVGTALAPTRALRHAQLPILRLLLLSIWATSAWASEPEGTGATLAEIEACARQNLPDRAGVIGFVVDAVDRTGAITQSRAELRWRKPESDPMRVMLVVSEPAKTAGTALLIVDRESQDPEFFVSLPEMKKVRKIRSRRMRGPVLGTDFSYEDLDRLRAPLSKAPLELIGSDIVEDRPAWLLETIPAERDRSEYVRVLTFIDQPTCLPVRIDLFEAGRDGAPRLRKQLLAAQGAIKPATRGGPAKLPHEFVMKDLKRETSTVIRIERFESSDDLPEEDFTRAALAEKSKAAQPAAARR